MLVDLLITRLHTKPAQEHEDSSGLSQRTQHRRGCQCVAWAGRAVGHWQCRTAGWDGRQKGQGVMTARLGVGQGRVARVGWMRWRAGWSGEQGWTAGRV